MRIRYDRDASPLELWIGETVLQMFPTFTDHQNIHYGGPSAMTEVERLHYRNQRSAYSRT